MKISLLIVEDDKEASGVIRGMIEKKLPELAIYQAESGKEGLKSFREHQPDIVISDINMPDMDGIAMAEEIKAMKEDTKFIIITGYSDKMDSFGGVGIQEYFVKPTDLRRLLAAIQRCVGQILLERKS